MTNKRFPPRMSLRPLAAAGEVELLIYGDIGEDFWGAESVSARNVVDQLAAADADLINVRINSYGGSVSDGLAIYNALRTHRAAIKVVVDGVAISSASLIAMAGDEVIMPAASVMMIHAPMTISVGNAVEMRKTAEALDTHSKAMAEAYAAKTGKPFAEMLALISDGDDHWFTGREAVEAGFADVVAGGANSEGVEPSNLTAAIEGAARYLNTAPQRIAAVLRVAPDNPTAGEQPMTAPNAAATTAEIQAQAHAAVRQRNDKIHAALNDVIELPGIRELYQAALRDPDMSVEAVLQKALAVQAAQVQPGNGGGGRVEGGEDQRDKFITGASKALAARGGIEKRETGNEFNGMTLSQLAAEAMHRSGVVARGMSPDQVARKVLAMHSTSDFPLLLSNTAGKALRAAYEGYASTYQLWCAIGSVSDFKPNSRIQLGSFNSLATVPELGEYTHGTVSEEAETIQAVTKGKMIGLSRQMIVNDDLGAFLRRASMLGRAAIRTVNNDAYALLASGASNNGPTMSDTGQLFNATAVTTAGGHANYLASGYAPTVASIAAGRAAMRKQKDKGLHDALNIEPRFLIAPVGLEDVAWAVINSTADPASANSNKRNYVRDQANLTLVTDPYLDGISATAWYLAADPADAPLIEVDFLDGQQTPFIDEEIDFDTDAMKLKVRLDYGLAAIDWRAGYRTSGTGGS